MSPTARFNTITGDDWRHSLRANRKRRKQHAAIMSQFIHSHLSALRDRRDRQAAIPVSK